MESRRPEPPRDRYQPALPQGNRRSLERQAFPVLQAVVGSLPCRRARLALQQVPRKVLRWERHPSAFQPQVRNPAEHRDRELGGPQFQQRVLLERDCPRLVVPARPSVQHRRAVFRRALSRGTVFHKALCRRARGPVR